MSAGAAAASAAPAPFQPLLDALRAQDGSSKVMLDAFRTHGRQYARDAARFVEPQPPHWTLLHAACACGDEVAARVLLRHGASNGRARSPVDGLPSDLAAARGHAALAREVAQAENGSAWASPDDATLCASSARWSDCVRLRAREALRVAYAGGVVRIPAGATYYADRWHRVLVGWHGTWSPPAGMDGESMLDMDAYNAPLLDDDDIESARP